MDPTRARIAGPGNAGPLRDSCLALDSRGGPAPRIGGTAPTGEETFEAVATGLGVALLSAGNADIHHHRGVTGAVKLDEDDRPIPVRRHHPATPRRTRPHRFAL